MTRRDAIRERLSGNETEVFAVLNALGIDTDRKTADSKGDVSELRLPPAIHADENPSFSFNIRDLVGHDFGGSAWKGDLFRLVQDARGCSFPEALDWLCGLLNLSPTKAQQRSALTVEDLSRDKGLPVEVLRSFGVRQRSGWVQITYLLEDCTEAPRQRKRTHVSAKLGSTWIGQKEAKPTPYGLSRLPEAREAGELYLVEGESDCWTLWHHEKPALGLPGADMTGKLEARHLEGIKRLYVVKEPDKGGETFVAGLKKRLRQIGFAGEVFVIEMPPDVKDPNEVHKRNPSEFGAVMDQLRRQARPLSEHEAPKETEEEKPKKRDKTQSEVLLELASEGTRFHTPDGEPYVAVPVGRASEAIHVRSKACRLWLFRLYYAAEGKTPSAQAVQDAIDTLHALALFEAPTREVHLRTALHEDTVYLDLCNEARQVVEVTPFGWRVVDTYPVLFRRPSGMMALPSPAGCSDLSLVRDVFGLEDGPLSVLLAFLVFALYPKGPYPLLAFHGEQGTGKTTKTRMVRQLLDPHEVPLRRAPKSEQDLMIAARFGHVLGFDNLSVLPDWLSDALCTMATGAGFGTRKLYSDDEETVLKAMRPVLLNGIDTAATRADLADRTLTITLPFISDENRLTDAEVWKRFDEAAPAIFAGLLDALSTALRNRPNTRPERLPRMADFALFAIAAEPAFPVAAGTFIHAIEGNREEADQEAIEGEPFAAAVLKLLQSEKTWEGTATDLMDSARAHLSNPDRPPRSFPKTGQGVGQKLRRCAPALRRLGIERTDPPKSGTKGVRLIRLEYAGKQTSETSETSKAAKSTQNGRFSSDVSSDDSTGLLSETSEERPSENELFGGKNAVSDLSDVSDDVSRSSSQGDGASLPASLPASFYRKGQRVNTGQHGWGTIESDPVPGEKIPVRVDAFASTPMPVRRFDADALTTDSPF